MTETIPIHKLPPQLPAILTATKAIGFPMASDTLTGALLRTLAASKTGSHLLEIGTGTGLSTAWLLDGMDATAKLTTVDIDADTVAIAQCHLGHDERLTFHVGDGGAFLESLEPASFDLIFADSWPGKYTHLDTTLALLKVGGLYVIDDMLPQSNWPDDHPPKVEALLARLHAEDNLHVTQLDWASGMVVATRRGG